MKISDTFRKGLRTHGDCVSQEGNFRNTENALGRVQKNGIILELSEKSVKMLIVFLGERLKTRFSSMYAKKKSRSLRISSMKRKF